MNKKDKIDMKNRRYIGLKKGLFIILFLGIFLIGLNSVQAATGTTQIVADIYEGSSGSVGSLAILNNNLYFRANDGLTGNELWSYDGTNAPSIVADINNGSNSYPDYLTLFNNKLYFQADGGDGAGTELWSYDGTNAPSRVADILNGSDSSSPGHLAVFNNKLYFQASGVAYDDVELWSYDGTNAPSRVADILNGSSSSNPAWMTVFNNKMYFSANNGTGGNELWSYDGTNAPSIVADIRIGSSSSNPTSLIVFNNKLYFGANNGTGGDELWSYDGTNAPSRVADVYSGSMSSYPGYFAIYKGKLHFKANGGDGAGTELWSYDGTNAPSRVADIRSGSSNSNPASLIVFNNKLYLSATNGTSGTELWSFTLTPANYYVDTTGTDNITQGTSTGIDAFKTIQYAINDSRVIDGDTVNVAAGTYDEQVYINKSITLLGTDNPTINPPTSPISYTFPESTSTWEPIIIAFGGTANASNYITGTDQITVNISGINVDGNNRIPSPNTLRAVGILYRNVVGGVEHSTVQKMGILSPSGNSWGIVVYGYSDVNIHGNTLSEYAKGGIVVNGDPSATIHAIIDGNTATGPAYVTGLNLAPNGIQIGFGATGHVTNNIVTNHGNTEYSSAGAGILIHGSSDVIVEGNTATDNTDIGIGVSGTSAFLSNRTIIRNNTVMRNGEGIRISVASINASVENNTVTNNEAGIAVYTSSTPNPIGTIVHNNKIYENTYVVYSGNYNLYRGSSVVEIVNATNNWWGSAVLATINSTISGNVTFIPYYVDTEMTTLSSTAPSIIYVNSTYSDGNSGGHIFGYDAFTTIQAGINASASGGTVNVAAGTYDGDLLIGKSLTLQGAGYNITTIRGVAGGSERTIDNTGANPITIDGFTISQVVTNPDPANNANSMGILFQGSAAATLTNCRIQNHYTGVFLSSISNGIIEYNIIKDNGNGVLMQGCESSGCTPASYFNNTQIKYNNFTGNGLGTSSSRAAVRITGPILGAGPLVNNNLFVGNININSGSAGAFHNMGEHFGTATIIDATNNYWGSSTGPVHTSNPNGRGDNVSNNVTFIPYYINAEMTSTSVDANGSATVTNSTPQVVITNSTQNITLTIEEGTVNASIDVSSLVSNSTVDGIEIITGAIPQITVNSDIAEIIIPATNVTCADTSWDGVIDAPTITTTVVPDTSTETMTTSMAIEIGFADAKLSFNNAVRILLPDQKDKRVGYSRTGLAFTEITNVCGGDNQTIGDALEVDGDCKINVGDDLVVWTKHFTSFTTFSSTAIVSTDSTPNSGGGSCAYDTNYNWACSAWGNCVDGKQTRTCNTNNNCGNTYGKPETEKTCVSGPAQLFDIKLELASAIIKNANELSSVITFTSFGNVPTPVDLTYSILDSSGKEIYSEKGSVTVTTEEIVRNNFESLDLPAGRYTLVLTTVYGVNVKDEFRQVFEIGKEEVLQNIKNNWIFFVIVGGAVIIFIIVFIIFLKKKKKNIEIQ